MKLFSTPTLGVLLCGAALGAALTLTLKRDAQEHARVSEAAPLYWVAPMDPNYRRDKPGLSPMGMELIPVYEDTQNTGAGIVHIEAHVVQNLGVRTAKVERKALEDLRQRRQHT